jgi:magnesium transporter
MQLFWRRHTPGTAPGTIAVAEPAAVPARTRVVEYGLDTLIETEVASLAELAEPKPGTVEWLDVEGRDTELIGELGKRFEIHPLVLEDVVNVGQRVKVEEFEDSLFVVIDHFFVDDESGALDKEQISLFVRSGVLLSLRERRSDLWEPVRVRLRTGRPRIRGGGIGYLAYALIDSVVDHVFPILESIGDRMLEIEEALLDSPTPEDLNRLHKLKRELLVLRKSMWPLRDMLNGLRHTDSELFSDETRLYLRDVVDHATMAVDIVETLREMVSSLMDLYLSSVSNRMNEIMKVLTIIATIFIPLSFVVGLYGMNFDGSVSPYNMPELRWYWGYPFVLGVMALMVVGLLAFFRHRDWL